MKIRKGFYINIGFTHERNKNLDMHANIVQVFDTIKCCLATATFVFNFVVHSSTAVYKSVYVTEFTSNYSATDKNRMSIWKKKSTREDEEMQIPIVNLYCLLLPVRTFLSWTFCITKMIQELVASFLRIEKKGKNICYCH